MALSTVQLSIVIAASLGAFLVAGWTFLSGTGDRGLPGCAAGSGCHEVTGGRWSRVGPLPVAFVGLLVYGSMLLALVGRVVGIVSNSGGNPDFLLAILGWMCIGAAVWFVFLQAMIIHRWCVYCLMTHVLAVIAAVILLSSIGGGTLPATAVICAILTVCFAIAQIVLKPKRYVIVSMRETPTAAEESVRLSESFTIVDTSRIIPGMPAYPRKHRNISLAGGRAKFDIFDFPLLGSPDATNVVAALVDFTCRECHHLHRLLRSAIDKFPNELAVAVIPIPLHEGCNPTVKCHRQDQAYACTFARLAWRVWLANPAAYAEWDAYLAEPTENQPFGLAWLRAKELADISAFKPGEPDAAADPRIVHGISLFESAQKPKVPCVLLPRGILKGHVSDLQTLLKLLEPHVKLI